jgi:hypothetical protein
MTALLTDLATLPNYRIPGDEPDPRGWAVISCDGTEVATVNSLLVEVDALKARYFICTMKNRDATTAIPVIYARLDPKHHRVIYDITPDTAFAALPPFSGTLAPADEKVIHAIVIGEVIEAPPPAPSADRRHQPRRE